MNNIMSKFNISNTVKRGKSTYNIKCPYCNKFNEITITNNLNHKKITLIKCKNCGNLITCGDIFNFDTGNKLNNRLDSKHDYDNYVNYQWNKNYDKI